MSVVAIDLDVYARKLREAGLDPRLAMVLEDTLHEQAQVARAPDRDGPDMWRQSVETRLSDLRGDIGDLRAEMLAFRSEMSAEFRNVRERQERDFRLMFGALITLGVGLAGLMAHGFKWIG